jgi:hypothetical protein
MIGNKKNTPGQYCSLKNSSADIKNIKTTASTLPNEGKSTDPPLEALKKYMK